MSAARAWPTARSTGRDRARRRSGLGPKTLPTRFAHAVICRFGPLWSLLGADRKQVETLTGVYLALDERRGKASHTDEQPTSPFTGGMLLTLAMNLLVGLMAGLVLLLPDPRWAMAIAQTLILSVAAMILVTDYSAVLLDDTDAALLSPMPVSDRTVLAARVAHIAAYLSLTVGALALPGLVFGAVKWGAWPFLPVWVLASLLTAVLAIGLSFGAFLAAARFLSPRRFQDATLFMQIGATVLFVGGFQVFPRMIERDLILSMKEWFPWFAWLVPGFHQGGMLALGVRDFDPRNALLAGLAVGMPILLVGVLVRLGRRGFLAGISARFGGEKEEVSATAFEAPSGGVADPLRRAGADFLALMTNRDRNYRLRAWPLVAIALFISLGMSLQRKGFGESSNVSVMSLYILGAYAPLFLLLTRFSQDWKARWIFEVAPIADAGPYLMGGWNVLALRRVAPVLGIGIVFTGIVGGLEAAAHGLFASGLVLALFGLIAKEFTRTMPFTRKPLRKDTSSLPLVFGAMGVAAACGLLHYVLSVVFEPLILFGGPVLWGVALLNLRRARFRRTPVRFE